MTKTTVLSRVFSCAAAAVMMLGTVMTTKPNIAASADTSNAAVNAAARGILEVELYYEPQGEDRVFIQTGTGFLVNSNTFVTCSHVINIDKSMQKAIADYYKDDYDPDFLKAYVMTLSDIEIPATLINSSADSKERDYAVMTVPQDSLSTFTPLVLSSVDNVNNTAEVYSLGYPGDTVDNISKTERPKFTAEQVTTYKGNISMKGFVFDDGVTNGKFLQHSAVLSPGNSGGPLLDSNGYVVGLNRGHVDAYYYSLEIDEVRNFLDQFNIEYQSVDGESASAETTAEPQQTEESVEETAPAVTTTAPVPAVTAAVDEDTSSDDEEESEKNYTPLIIAFAGIAVVLIVLIIIFATKGSKKAPPAPVGPTVVGQSGGVPNGFVPPTPPSPYQQSASVSTQPQRPAVPAQATMGFEDSGAGETSLLNAGAGETSVLGGPAVRGAMLVRRKNNTNVTINRPEFVIGKERSRVNYCVNNNAISRQHAKISNSGGVYYITDLNSSNYTFVNGNQLTPNTPQQLNNGDVIKMADEEFEFRG